MNNRQKRIAEEAFKKLAEIEGVTVEYVRNEIMIAMQAAMNDPDPDIQAWWKQIPCEGEIPTPEEFIIHASGQIKRSMRQ